MSKNSIEGDFPRRTRNTRTGDRAASVLYSISRHPCCSVTTWTRTYTAVMVVFDGSLASASVSRDKMLLLSYRVHSRSHTTWRTAASFSAEPFCVSNYLSRNSQGIDQLPRHPLGSSCEDEIRLPGIILTALHGNMPSDHQWSHRTQPIVDASNDL